MECFCNLHRNISFRCIVLPQFSHVVLSQGYLIATFQRSLIAISQDHGSQYRLIVMCLLCNFARCDMRYRISAIFKVFQRECLLIHAMRWSSRRNLTFYHFDSQENALSFFVRCDIY